MIAKACGLLGLLVVLTACGVPKAREAAAHEVPARAAPSQAPRAPHEAGSYQIDPAESEVRLLVYRAGALAGLGHNHVIVNRAVRGWVRATPDPLAATFSLTLPVTDFIVDDSAARREEGADFAEDISPEASAGTRHNMLGAALLDVAAFPAITLTSVAVIQESGHLSAQLLLRIAGHQSSLLVPFTLERSPGRALASGITVLRQTDMGLIPFSVMLGALQVQDQITVKFKLVAVST